MGIKLINKFTIGADPEFVLQSSNNNGIVNYKEALGLKKTLNRWGEAEYVGNFRLRNAPIGHDHGGNVVELHPKPSKSSYILLKHIKETLFNSPQSSFIRKYPWRAGGFFWTPLGGHIHFRGSKETLGDLEFSVVLLDTLVSLLEIRDILPREESLRRRNHPSGYGNFGDVRIERVLNSCGEFTKNMDFEYRVMPSWLFSPGITYLCLTAAKLIVSAPVEVEEVFKQKIRPIEKLFELFASKDNDARRVQERLLIKTLIAKPERDFREIWGRKNIWEEV